MKNSQTTTINIKIMRFFACRFFSLLVFRIPIGLDNLADTLFGDETPLDDADNERPLLSTERVAPSVTEPAPIQARVRLRQ